jgi:rRNA maturation RNase YbeY
MDQARRLAPADRWNEVSLVLEDDAGIRKLNRTCFGIAEPTDVLCFRFDPIPGEPRGPSAEIVVNVECALREGRALPRRTPSSELALYVAHACDHLAGGRDDTPAGRARMRRRELRWLRRAGRLGLLDRLVKA